MANDDHITFNDARLLFKNFAGRETKFNREGDRNFCVVIPDQEMVDLLLKDGWNVKNLAPREEGDEPLNYMKVSVSYKGRPPKIVIITSRGRTSIDVDLVSMLDFADMTKVDLIVRPYHWNVKGDTGVSAYLKTMFVTIWEDELELRYADVPEIGFTPPLAIGSGDFIDGEVIE